MEPQYQRVCRAKTLIWLLPRPFAWHDAHTAHITLQYNASCKLYIIMVDSWCISFSYFANYYRMFCNTMLYRLRLRLL